MTAPIANLGSVKSDNADVGDVIAFFQRGNSVDVKDDSRDRGASSLKQGEAKSRQDAGATK